MADASLTSEPEKLLPEAREFFALECEKHGFDTQAAAIRAGNISYVDGGQVCIDAMIAFARHRLSSPVSGTDMVERLAQAMWASEDEPGTLDESGRRGTFERLAHAALSASPTPPIPVTTETLSQKQAREVMMPQSGGCASQGSAQSYGAPIPVIAEAGEREAIIGRWRELADYSRAAKGDHRSGVHPNTVARELDKAADMIAALSTPATLDNTAVEAVIAAIDLVWFATDFNHRQACAAVRAALAAPINKIGEDASQRQRTALGDMIDLAHGYAEYIAGVPACELERHPYLPGVEQAINDAREVLSGGQQ